MSPHQDRSTSPAERIYRVGVEGQFHDRRFTFPEAVARAEREAVTAVLVVICKIPVKGGSIEVARWHNGNRLKTGTAP